MSARDRLQSERTFHDRQARARVVTFEVTPTAFCFADDDYLDHESWIRPAFERLGDLQGLRILDCGCGHGMAAVVMARRGAHITGLDLSAGYLQEAQARARANGAAIDWVQADLEWLPFQDGAFDRVWGNAVLHHLDIERAGPELHRILKPGGRAVFCEPWGENRLLNWVRESVPYPGKQRTSDERPLRRRDLKPLERIFRCVELRGFQLLGMARRLVHSRRLRTSLDWCDHMLLSRIPRLEQFCRYAVLTLER